MSAKNLLILSVLILFLIVVFQIIITKQSHRQWQFESIDTMKYSRDLARQKMNDSSFDQVIDAQMSKIAKTGATHVAIDTPYDPEFLPMLKRWVSKARIYHLQIWFRGNFSGWEEWFGYKKINEETHLKKTQDFILQNRDLFENGDIFSSCPECENGAKLNFGKQDSIKNYENFLIREYEESRSAFNKIGKGSVPVYFSMNYDVAKAVMDPEMTKKLGGVVVIDHYVSSSVKMAGDIKNLAISSKGKVILGEFGAPIPDIHGKMTDAQQNDWIARALADISQDPELTGVNYWVNTGGSTALWNDNGNEKPVVSTLSRFYQGKAVKGIVSDIDGNFIDKANIRTDHYRTETDRNGIFYLPCLHADQKIYISAIGYRTQILPFNIYHNVLDITLEKQGIGFYFNFNEILQFFNINSGNNN